MANDGKERPVICEMCGVTFAAYGNRAKYCPICKEEKRREAGKKKRRVTKKKENARPKGLTLAEIVAKANELHMTYGEYVTRFGG